MRKSLQETETTWAPKRKFAFKKPGQSGRVALPGTPESSTAVGQQLRQDEHTSDSDARPDKFVPERPASPTSNASSGFRWSKLEAKHVTLTPLEKNGAFTASLEDIAKSCVDISLQASQEAPFATLMVLDVEKSLLVLGNIAGSAHMTGIADSAIFVTAQQIRLHNCHEVVLYVRCSSRPIIEGCTGIRFAPLNYLFVRWPPLFEKLYQQAHTLACQGREDVISNLSKPNFWDQVDDFKWLKAEPSPNWSVLRNDDDRAISDKRCYDILHQSISKNLDLEALLASAMIPL